MKNTRRDDLDFDFDVKKEKSVELIQPKSEFSFAPKSKKGNRVRLGAVTLDLSEDCLIIRRRTRTTKEKTMVSLDEIESTKVKRVSRPFFLFLAILFLVVGGVGAYPVYLYLQSLVYAVACAGAGLLLFIIFLIIFLSTRRLQFILNFSRTRNIKYLVYDTKQFEKLNEFIDEVYHAKHQL